MKKIENIEECFSFLSWIYDEIPDFNEFNFFGIDKMVLDDKGFDETAIEHNGLRHDFARYYAILRKPSGSEYAIVFENDVTFTRKNEVLYDFKANTIRQQLTQKGMDIDNELLLIILDERCEIIEERDYPLRSLTIYCGDNIKTSHCFDQIMFGIEQLSDDYAELAEDCVEKVGLLQIIIEELTSDEVDEDDTNKEIF